MTKIWCTVQSTIIVPIFILSYIYLYYCSVPVYLSLWKIIYKTKREQLQPADVVVLIALDSAPADLR